MSNRVSEGFSIGVLAARAGVTPGVLRTWENRFGFPRGERSASGQIFLTFLAEADETVRRRVRSTVEEVRANRMAVTDGLLNAGFAAISVPVFDHLGDLAGAMTTLGAAGHLDTSREGATASALRAAGENTSAALGYRPERGSEPRHP